MMKIMVGDDGDDVTDDGDGDDVTEDHDNMILVPPHPPIRL